MAEYLQAGNQWLSVEKLIRVEDQGHLGKPCLVVHFQGGDSAVYDGQAAQRVLAWLKSREVQP